MKGEDINLKPLLLYNPNFPPTQGNKNRKRVKVSQHISIIYIAIMTHKKALRQHNTAN